MTRLYVVSDCGGVGRTTVAANLAHALAARGERVRLRDEDRQGALAVHFRSLESPLSRSGGGVTPFHRTLATNIEIANTGTDRPGGNVSGQASAHANARVGGHGGQHVASPTKIGIPLEIIDTPVGRTFSEAELGEEDHVLTVIAPEARCYRTLPALLERHASSGLVRNFVGVVNAHEPESSLARDTLHLVEEALGGRLLTSTVMRDLAVLEAFAAGLPVADYAPWSQAANAFGQMADTFIAMKVVRHAVA